jgi:two-component system, chemotaxis family, CheB/CheR fusion protein
LAQNLPERESARLGSGLGERIRAFDWAGTEVGAIARWPAGLRNVLDLMLGSNQAMFMVLGTEHRLLYNDPATALLGRRHPTALGQPLRTAWPEVADELGPGLAEACGGSPAWIDRVRLRAHAAGRSRERLFGFALSPLRDDAGRLHGAVCTCNEIARHHAGRDDLNRLQALADTLPALVWMTDARGRLQLANTAFCEYLGASRDDLLASGWTDRLHPDDAPHLLDGLAACTAERKPLHRALRLKHRDGDWRWFDCRARPRFGANDEAQGCLATAMELPRRNPSATALHDDLQGFRIAADQMPHLAWMADAAGGIFRYNARWFEYTGQSADLDPATAWRAAQHPGHVDRVAAKIARCFGNREPFEDIFPLCGHDGDYRWFLCRALPIRDEAGGFAGWVGTHTDVTEQRAEAERLREAERQTSEFLAVLGHELRNPLAAVRSAAELVSLSQTSDHRLHRARVVLERQCIHMTRLIDSLLEVSRISRGKVRLDRKTLDLRTVLDDMLQDRSPQIVDSGLTFERQLPDEPLWVLADEVRLAQIFDNLIGNAMKFTEPPGRITVAARRRGDEVEVRVQDTGVGLRPEVLTHIFEPFHQDARELPRAAGGLGLGLALAKGLTELHGGTIEARSGGPDTGAEFIVRLPATAAPAAEPGPERPSAAERRRILIVEDNVDVAEMLQFLLRMKRHRVHVAADGAAALEVLRREPIDIVLCDLGLPVMSGYDLAREIRSDPALCRVVLVALTGYGRSSDRRRTEEAGFDAHLTKPVELDDLNALLGRIGR